MKKNQIPTHIAIIMDGNRRWARERSLPVLAGHQRVADEVLEPLVEHAAKRGIRYITFWAFSTENWQRDAKEVQGIMRIFRHVIQKRWQRLHEKGVQIRVIGDVTKFAPDIVRALADVVEQTKNNKRITAVFALNYGGRDEILRGIKRVTSGIVAKAVSIDEAIQQCSNITIEQFNNVLDTSCIPDPDLIVRTGSEQRLSGFLLWQCQYSELAFPSWFMPEFTPKRLDELLDEYGKRSRRYGK